MNSAASFSSVRLKAASADLQSEVFVIDHQLNLVKRGVGQIDAEFPPGLYKVKFKSSSLDGSLIREEIVSLAAGSPTVEVNDARPEFAS